jgi:hypothetical protein
MITKKTMLCKIHQFLFYKYKVPSKPEKLKPEPMYIFKDGEIPCGLCESRPVAIEKRGLCKSCYLRLRYTNDLIPLPRKEEDKRKERAKNGLIKRYGPGILDDFELLKKNPAWTLERLGEKYGFSREYARQAYKFIIGHKYGEDLKNKSKLLKVEIGCANDPRHKVADYKKGNSNIRKSAESELLFYQECESKGFKIDIPCKKEVDIKVNGYWVDVKSAHTPILYPEAKTPYLRIGISEKQRNKSDFIAFYHSIKKSFYIIPRLEFLKNKSKFIYIPTKKSPKKNSGMRYEKYKDAWQLLA